MAHLEVTPKKSNLAWLWILIILVILAILYFLFMKPGTTTTTETLIKDSTTISQPTAKNVVAATQPDWDNVNFDASTSSDTDITDKDVEVRSTDGYTVYSLGENILFATGQNTIQEGAKTKLSQVAASLKRNYKGAYIGVYGNTDSVGTSSQNNQLGAERAAAVRDWLVSSGGIENSNISIHSLGENKPVANNTTEKGRQQNRNVKIVAFKTKQ